MLPSWTGVTDAVRERCTRLSLEGFAVLAPDVLQGRTGEDALAAVDPNHLTSAVQSSVRAVQRSTPDATAPVGVIGYSMGGSLALWAGARFPGEVSAVVTYYGTQDMDLSTATAEFLGHFAGEDHLVSGDDRRYTEALLGLAGHRAEFHVYPGTRHWFAEADSEAFDEAASEVAWERTVEFLHRVLETEGSDLDG